MLRSARRAPILLRDRAGLVVDFVTRQQRSDGGFADRAGRSDLYYTVFALECLNALDALRQADAALDYLKRFTRQLHELDLVHLSCLARCMDILGAAGPHAAAILERVERFRSADGGYNQSPGSALGSAYGGIVAIGAYQDLAAEPPAVGRLVDCLSSLKTADGGYANEPGLPVALTPPTAAVLTILREQGRPTDASAVEWLLRQASPEGGFLAMPAAPVADLLSTATALHALACAGADLTPIRETTLEFVDRLWREAGGFAGHEFDNVIDCEYTFYGLLAMGELADESAP